MHNAAGKRILLVAALALITPCAGGLTAGPPEVMRYQARLTDAAGVPLSDPVTATFAIYSVQNGGTALWSEVHSVTPAAGSVDVLLGETIPLASAIVNAPDRWLEVAVDAGGGPKVLGPRQRLASVPFSLVADRLGNKTLTEVEAGVAASIGTHAANSSAHHVKTTSASELTSGTLDPARIAADSLTAAHILDGPGSGLDADLLDGLQANELIDAAGPVTCQTVTFIYGSLPNNSDCGAAASKTFTCPTGTVLLNANLIDPNGVTQGLVPQCTTYGTNSITTKCKTTDQGSSSCNGAINTSCTALLSGSSTDWRCSLDRIVLNCCL